jgi:hypothetical protein
MAHARARLLHGKSHREAIWQDFFPDISQQIQAINAVVTTPVMATESSKDIHVVSNRRTDMAPHPQWRCTSCLELHPLSTVHIKQLKLIMTKINMPNVFGCSTLED